MWFGAYYAALKPERTYANVITTAAGFLFACQWHIRWPLLIATISGTTLVVMSACAANNCTDRNIDARMPRTKKRGTVTGSVPIQRLAVLAGLLGTLGFIILALWVNGLTLVLGFIAYIDYVLLYGWSKRTTPYSTLIGTLSGAVPLIAGYTAVTNRFDMTALLLGLVMVFWQMVHFYAIAMFRHNDYAAANIPVWSVRYGMRSTQWWMLAYTLMYLLAVVGLALFGHAGKLFLLIIGSLGIYWFYLGLKGFNHLDVIKWSRSMFGFSLITLLIVCGGLCVSSLFKY